jgi:hypothetical protein
MRSEGASSFRPPTRRAAVGPRPQRGCTPEGMMCCSTSLRRRSSIEKAGDGGKTILRRTRSGLPHPPRPDSRKRKSRRPDRVWSCHPTNSTIICVPLGRLSFGRVFITGQAASTSRAKHAARARWSLVSIRLVENQEVLEVLHAPLADALQLVVVNCEFRPHPRVPGKIEKTAFRA